jgi:hypothetical protein
MTQELGSALRRYDLAGNTWTVPIVPGRALTPPRVLRAGNRTLIMFAYTGGRQAGGHLVIVSQGGTKLLDYVTCLHLESRGIGLPGFSIDGIDLGYPYPETAAIAVRMIESSRGPEYYVVAATDRCGVSFLRLDPTPSIPTLQPVDLHESDAFFSAPAIAQDGTAVIVDSRRRVTGYDVTTGNERWKYDAGDEFVWGPPALLPLGNNTVYVASDKHVFRFDTVDGQLLNHTPISGTDARLAAGGNYLFVSTTTNLLTFDLNLTQVASVSLTGGGWSSPAIGLKGEVHVAATDGWYRVFPGF